MDLILDLDLLAPCSRADIHPWTSVWRKALVPQAPRGWPTWPLFAATALPLAPLHVPERTRWCSSLTEHPWFWRFWCRHGVDSTTWHRVSSSRSNLQNLFAVCRKTRSKTDDMKCNTYATPLKCVDKEVKPLWIRASTGHKSKKTNTTCYCEFAIVDTPNPPHHVLLVFDSSHLLNAKAL